MFYHVHTKVSPKQCHLNKQTHLLYYSLLCPYILLLVNTKIICLSYFVVLCYLCTITKLYASKNALVIYITYKDTASCDFTSCSDLVLTKVPQIISMLLL